MSTHGAMQPTTIGRYHRPPFHVVESATGRIVAEAWTAHRAFRVTEELDRATLRPHHVRNVETGRTVR